jgi:hypothetical protein
LVSTDTDQTDAELVTGLYSGLQPLRSAQEAVKKFARKLDPQFDQLGIVAFTNDCPGCGTTDNTDVQADANRRSKLQCLTYASQHLGNPARCYDATLSPITYTAVISAVERHWAESGTNIASGMREGLEELGISTPGNPATSGGCSLGVNDGMACDRRGAARRIIILMTDGSPNGNPGNCNGGAGGRPDLWEGLLGTEDADFECAMYYAFLADDNNVTVYTIGIGAGANRDLLTAMATGDDPGCEDPACPGFVAEGQYFPAAKPTDLDLIFEQILSNIYVRIVG